METIKTVDDQCHEALQDVERAIKTENALPPPNPYLAVFFNATFSALLVIAVLYSVYALYEGIDLYPVPDAHRSRALTLALARESLVSVLTGLLVAAGSLLCTVLNIKRRILEELCSSKERQCAFYDYDDDWPKAPDALRDAAHALRLNWPSGAPEPRLLLTYVREGDWTGAPPHVRWSIELPGSGEKAILPPATRQRSYALSQF